MDPTAKFLTDKNWHVNSKVITFFREALTSASKCTLKIHFETEKKGFIDDMIIKIFRWCDIYVVSHADVLRLVTHSSPRDKPKNVCIGGYYLW